MDSLSSHSFENLGAGRQFSETKGGGVSFCILLENLKVQEFQISWKRRKNRVDKDTGQHH